LSSLIWRQDGQAARHTRRRAWGSGRWRALRRVASIINLSGLLLWADLPQAATVRYNFWRSARVETDQSLANRLVFITYLNKD
jgi:hypothetical protein